MAADFFIKAGDTSPALVSTLKDADGAVVDLTGATVRFVMKPVNGTVPTVDGTADVDSDPTTGIVSYTWTPPVGEIPGDTDIDGEYEAEFEVTFADDSIQTFPNSRYLRVKVLRQLG